MHSLKRSQILYYIFIVVLGFSFLMIGCGNSNVTRDNFGKIQIGWSKEQVKNLLGEPNSKGDFKVRLIGSEKLSEQYGWSYKNNPIFKESLEIRVFFHTEKVIFLQCKAIK